jgi:hypothetical protein
MRASTGVSRQRRLPLAPTSANRRLPPVVLGAMDWNRRAMIFVSQRYDPVQPLAILLKTEISHPCKPLPNRASEECRLPRKALNVPRPRITA